MFKKKSIKQSNLRRRRETNNDDDSDTPSEGGSSHTNDGSQKCESVLPSTYEQLQQKKKRRMILESLQYKKGINAVRLLQTAPGTTDFAKESEMHTDDNEDPYPHQQPQCEGVLEQKHRKAMEEYIETNLGITGENKKDSPQDVEQNRKDGMVMNSKEKLYAQLAEAAIRLSGKSTESHAQDVEIGEGFVGGGVGLAEVILPVEERLATLEETARAAAKSPKPPSSGTDILKRLPTSKPNHNNPVLSRFSVPNSKPKLPNEYATATTNPDTQHIRENSNEDTLNDERVGFHAFRQQQQQHVDGRGYQKQQQDTKAHQRDQHATDDRAFKNFVTKQRERRQNR